MGRIPKANRKGYKIVEFDENSRKSYLNGFQKRNQEKKKKAVERKKGILLSERKRIKKEKQKHIVRKYVEAVEEINKDNESKVIELNDHLITITPISNMSANGLHLGVNDLVEKAPDDDGDAVDNDDDSKEKVPPNKRKGLMKRQYIGNNHRKKK